MATDDKGTTPASNGGITKDELTGLLKPLMEAQTKLTEQVTALAAANKAASEKPAEKKPEAAAQPSAGGVTLDQVKQTIVEAMTANQQQQANQQKRDTFITQSLGKLPRVYQQQLGNDPAKWEDEVKTIQAEFEKDLRGTGTKPENKGGASRDGGTPAAQVPIDKSKLTPVQSIESGLKE